MADMTLEGEFYHYMQATSRVDPEFNSRVLGFYVPYFVAGSHVLDLGCGQGQFIELLQQRGMPGSGVDSDAEMVRVCRAKGLDVTQADVFAFLLEHPAQYDGIFCSNVVEHLAAADVVRLVSLARIALKGRGVFLVATPNPESLIVHLHEFWRDATHVRMYSRDLLSFLLTYGGFCDVSSGENPRASWELPLALRLLAEDGRLALDSKQQPIHRRLLRRLRRGIADLLAQQVMIEEFAMLSALVRLQAEPFGRARESFAVGFAPSSSGPC